MVASGVAAPGRRQKRTTIKDVAIHAGVSIATVSRVLNGVASVDAALAERVRAACAALRFQPNRAARAQAGRQSAIIGLLVTDLQNPFFMEVVRGVEDVAQRHGLLLVLCNSAEDASKERRYIEVLCTEPVAGAIVVPTREQQPARRLFQEYGIPVVAIDRRIKDPSTDVVLIDNVEAARQVVAHLIGNGYRRIGALTGPQSTTTGRERLQGYRLALHQAGLPHDATIERRGSYSQQSARRLAAELLALDPPLDAFFTANNRITMGVIEALHAQGLTVPDDVAVAGFDEVPWAGPGSVAFTAVVQPAYEIGRAAAMRLVQRLQHPDVLTRQEIVLAHQLIIRDSSRPRIPVRPRDAVAVGA